MRRTLLLSNELQQSIPYADIDVFWFMTKGDVPERRHRLRPVLWVLIAAAMAAEWVLLVAGTKLHEMIAGALSAGLTMAFFAVVMRSETLTMEFSLPELAMGWTIPWDLLARGVQITSIFFKDLFGIRAAGSFYRVSLFPTEKNDPVMIGRRVLATIYTTAAPNFIVIGIDFDSNRMLFHQLERSDVPATTRKLGAEG